MRASAGLVNNTILVDIGGYWKHLRALLDYIVAERFARPTTQALLQVVPTVATLMAALAAEPAPARDIDADCLGRIARAAKPHCCGLQNWRIT
jgi:predicted Rossmann-fold nucleotide-binding protein